MLAALRRCPASLPRTISSVALSSRGARVAASAEFSAAWRQSGARPTLFVSAFHQTARWRQQAAEAVQLEDAPELITKFTELEARGMIHPNVIRTITHEMRFDSMTDVQSQTINEALKGTDIIAQARTGTGKTMGFLLPVLQNILKEDPRLAERGRIRSSASDIRALIISPTRELAEQIAAEARRLTRNTSVIVQTAVGGTQKRAALQQMQQQGCHILVGTPGRLNDIFSDTYTGVTAPKLSCLVLDEADRLLDAGFQQEIRNIQSMLPDIRERDRQTLMFSATVPREVVGLVRQTLKPGFQFVKTVREDEEPTHHRVPQMVVNAGGLENLVPSLVELCQREIQKAKEESTRPFKAIVFFNTTAEVRLAAEVIAGLGSMGGRHPLHPANIYEIHSRLTQAGRTRASDSFRRAKSGILLSSDVTARGMDFPDVTHVIQIGIPRDGETYVHRIGRTARAGKEGEGWLIIPDIETHFIRRKLSKIPLRTNDSLECAKIDMSQEASLPKKAADILNDIGQSVKKVDRADLKAAYVSFFGVYQGLSDKQRLVEAINRLALYGWGLPQPPSISPSLVHKLGLSRVRGLNQSSARDEFESREPRSGFGDRDGSGRRGGFGGRDSRGSRDGFGDRDGRGGRGGFSRGDGFGDRDGFRNRGGFGDRSGQRDRGSFGSRSGRSYGREAEAF